MKSEFKITLYYIVFGLLWIFATDQAVIAFYPELSDLATLQTAKGSLFVFLSGLIVFLLSSRYFTQRREREEDRLQVFQNTVRVSNHILRNYLNQMNLVIVEANDAPGFDKEVIQRAEKASEKASDQLNKLAELERYSLEEIGRLSYEDAYDDKIFSIPQADQK